MLYGLDQINVGEAMLPTASGHLQDQKHSGSWVTGRRQIVQLRHYKMMIGTCLSRESPYFDVTASASLGHSWPSLTSLKQSRVQRRRVKQPLFIYRVMTDIRAHACIQLATGGSSSWFLGCLPLLASESMWQQQHAVVQYPG